MKRRLAMAALGSTALVAAVLAAACLGSGCSSIGYLAGSVNGHLALVESAKPIDAWLADPSTDAALKERLRLAQRIRDFAVSDLKEPDNAAYRRYADLHRAAAVWNVVAAPELSLVLKTWCFPVVGCVGYRGYYAEVDANAEAADLRRDGWEANVYPVPAYSTLGALPFDWLADPLLNTFIDYPEGELARLIFHELAHQVAYAKGDTEFNESFATAVERIGGERWLQTRASPEARAAYARLDARRRDFRALTAGYRARLAAVYASGLPDSEKRERKAELFAALRRDHETQKRERWNGYTGYDAWFARADNASLGVLAAYDALVPAFERLFAKEGRDFSRFYAEVRRLAALPDNAARRRALEPLREADARAGEKP